MKQTELLLGDVERDIARSRRALEQVPANQAGWKPHERSMEFGYLAGMVANIFSWVSMIIDQDELDIAPKDGPRQQSAPLQTKDEYLAALDKSAGSARKSLSATSDEHLQTPWRLLAAGQVVLTMPRHEFIRDTLSHLAHHRGQMTVYLRLMGATVPALYGPSADDQRF